MKLLNLIRKCPSASPKVSVNSGSAPKRAGRSRAPSGQNKCLGLTGAEPTAQSGQGVHVGGGTARCHSLLLRPSSAAACIRHLPPSTGPNTQDVPDFPKRPVGAL